MHLTNESCNSWTTENTKQETSSPFPSNSLFLFLFLSSQQLLSHAFHTSKPQAFNHDRGVGVCYNGSDQCCLHGTSRSVCQHGGFVFPSLLHYLCIFSVFTIKFMAWTCIIRCNAPHINSLICLHVRRGGLFSTAVSLFMCSP